MRNYQLVPYLVHVHMRASPSDIRPLNDIDGRRTKLIDVIAGILSAARGQTLRHPSDPNRYLEVTSVRRARRSIIAELSPGRGGIESELQLGTRRVKRRVRDVEWPPVRYLFYFPAGSHHSVLLAEKVGVSNGIGVVGPMLHNTFKSHDDARVLAIESAMTPDLLREWAEQNPINAMILRSPRRDEDDQRLMRIGGRPVRATIEVRPGRGQFLPWRSVHDGELLGALSSELGLDVEGLEEWSTAVEVNTPTKSRRTIQLSGGGMASIAFPEVVDEDGYPIEQATRPSEEQFVTAAVRVMLDYAGHFGVPRNVAEHCQWEDGEWSDDAQTGRWTIDWGDTVDARAPR